MTTRKSKAESAADRQARAKRLGTLLEKLYPDAHCALSHRNPFELLVATILSAQCTDVRVNMVTPNLFARFPTPSAMAHATTEELEAIIKSTGFYRNKAKSILGASRLIVEKHGGNVPSTMDELLELPGVARKTANVVLGNAFGQSVGVVVDTHVGRLSRRMGLTAEEDPVKVEQELMKLFPRDRWTMLSHLLISHGRQVCDARKPKCDVCTIRPDCPHIGVDGGE
ncbi:MAG: endonuclease III [Phycisphaeraceae bacterium]|nr:endonuclease III [Phycisphaeraceae bacterium]